MTTAGFIHAREKEIEVPAAQLSATLLKIREAGGWVPRMDAKLSNYVLHVHWGELKEQGELL